MSTGTRLIDEVDAAARIGRPSSTLRYWRYDGNGPEDFPTGVHIGKRVMYDAASIEAWLAAQFAKAEQERAQRRAEATA